MDKIQLSNLLDNYVKGICTPDEIAIINKWYDQYEIGGPEYVGTLSADEREFLKRKMFARIMVNEAEAPENHDNISKVLIGRKWWLGVAAAAVLLLFVKIVILAPHQDKLKKNYEVSQVVQYVNKTNTIAKQELPDGSIVWLEPNSLLSYPKVFGPVSRNVSMKGECFFEVTKNPKHPFVINSDHLITKVWGTSFRITDYGDSKMAKVIVVTGKVSVSKKGSNAAAETLAAGEIMIHPKEEVIYHTDKNVLTQAKHADMLSLNIWNRVDLSFDNTRLKDIAAVLNKKFDTNIIVKDEALGRAMMNADLTDLNLPEVLEVLKASLKFNYEVNGNRILLKRTN